MYALSSAFHSSDILDDVNLVIQRCFCSVRLLISSLVQAMGYQLDLCKLQWDKGKV